MNDKKSVTKRAMTTAEMAQLDHDLALTVMGWHRNGPSSYLDEVGRVTRALTWRPTRSWECLGELSGALGRKGFVLTLSSRRQESVAGLSWHAVVFKPGTVVYGERRAYSAPLAVALAVARSFNIDVPADVDQAEEEL